MTAPLRLAAFAALLAAMAALAFGTARALDVDLSDAAAVADRADSQAGHGGHDSAEGVAELSAAPAGLAADDGAYRLSTSWRPPAPGVPTPLSFQVLDRAGAAVTEFDLEHDKRLHLVVVRRDLAHFQHLHPELATSGTWSQSLTLPAAGSYRMYADFTIGGEKHTLGTDLPVSGDFAPVPLPDPRSEIAVDGYTVTLAAHPRAGEDSELGFRVARAGVPVTDLQPYLGARGHLVALRGDDLAYLHVHPTPEGAPDSLAFAATFPSVGAYRLYLQFRSDDVVHTAELTLVVHHG